MPMLIDECFAGPLLPPLLSWSGEPEGWRLTPDGLVVAPAANTDFWQRTHYGFRVDRGPCLLAPVRGDFTMETEVAFGAGGVDLVNQAREELALRGDQRELELVGHDRP